MLKKLRRSRMKKELKTKLTQERIIEAALIEFSQKGYKAFWKLSLTQAR
jgi:AcrR family transcriptional regulator